MKFSPEESYKRWYHITDLDHVVVKEDIARGARMGHGITDIHHHLPRLLKLAEGDVLEIGTRFGASTSALLWSCEMKGGHLWSIDTDANCAELFDNPRWTFICANSITEVDRIKSMIPATFDLVFIDGDHSYEAVKSDLANYGPLGKVVALHDAQRHGHEGVIPAIFEYLGDTNCRQKEGHFYTDSHGLAVLS